MHISIYTYTYVYTYLSLSLSLSIYIYIYTNVHRGWAPRRPRGSSRGLAAPAKQSKANKQRGTVARTVSFQNFMFVFAA